MGISSIVRAKNTQTASEGANKKMGTTIIPKTIKSATGKKTILRITAQRRYLTSCRADRRACNGNISGRVTMYRENNEELNMYSDNSDSKKVASAQITCSRAVIAMPLATTI